MFYNKVSTLLFCCMFYMLVVKNLQGQDVNLKRDSFQIVFYNVENLFAPNSDVLKDNELSLIRVKSWNERKYQKKINMLSQAIITFSSYKFPEILALAEIENSKVLSDLMSSKIFKSSSYQVIHKDSPDRRGIDVGLLYDTNFIHVVHTEFIPVQLSPNVYSRDILYVKAMLNNDSIHFFVNHWPSRYSGARNSVDKRKLAAEKLLAYCDSIYHAEKNAKIVLMGDFNDEPHDQSLKMLTEHQFGQSMNKYLFNLMGDPKEKLGTIKYQGRWFTFDQFIVSQPLFLDNGLTVSAETSIANIDFLLIDDKKYLGFKPFRTYNGYKYIGGYSDHLPIKLVVKFEE